VKHNKEKPTATGTAELAADRGDAIFSTNQNGQCLTINFFQ